jgi:uncharacterized protein YndB with AHSA1/START domain
VKVTATGDREIVITRVLDAPRRLVYEALTRPEHLRRWLLGPPGWTMTVCDNDMKVGGSFRHEWKGEGGVSLAMHGVYREIVPNERIVRTETFDMGCPDQAGEQLATLRLTESGGRTTVTIQVLFPSKEARDGLLQSGMEQGMNANYAHLEELLRELPAAGRAKGGS